MIQAAFALFCFAGFVRACSCEVNSLPDERGKSREIFRATVTRQDHGIISLNVDRVWKGQVRAEEKIWIDPVCHPGPSDLKIGEGVLVFAMERWPEPGDLHNVFVLRGCTRSARLTETKDVAELGSGHPPMK